MSIQNLFGVGGNFIDQPLIKTGTHQTTVTQYLHGNNIIEHFIDSQGLHLKNKNSNDKLLSFDHDDNILPCILKSHIETQIQDLPQALTDITNINSNLTELNTLSGLLQSNVSSHDTRITRVQNQTNTLSLTTTNNVTRLTALEGIVTGGAGLEIDNILTIGNDAGGLEIVNLSNVSSEKVTVGGIELTSVGGVLTCGNDISVPVLNAGSINCITGGDTLLGKSIIDDSTMFAVRCSDNKIISYSDAELIGFKTIDDMTGEISDLTNRIVVLEQYNVKLRKLIMTISQSISLVDFATGVPFNYTDLIPEF